MLEVYGDLWSYPADVHVITTNGFTRNDGTAVMGRGVARQAADRWPGLDAQLGECLREDGNHVYLLTSVALDGTWLRILSFPVKHHWFDQADLARIEQSAHELAAVARAMGYRRAVLPRPGCGNGGLKWENVKPVLEPVLDDRFHVITNEEPPHE